MIISNRIIRKEISKFREVNSFLINFFQTPPSVHQQQQQQQNEKTPEDRMERQQEETTTQPPVEEPITTQAPSLPPAEPIPQVGTRLFVCNEIELLEEYIHKIVYIRKPEKL